MPPLPYLTPSEGAEKQLAQHRYQAAMPLVDAPLRDVIERYVKALEGDLLADYDRWCRVHEIEMSPVSVLDKSVSRPSRIGYVQVAHLRHPDEIRDALRDVLERGATSLILDLRDAPGGNIEQTVKVASEFIAFGPVMQTTEHGDRRVYDAIGNGVAMDSSLRIVVLQSRFTASAAEAVLAALKHHKRAVLVGEVSFGKVWLWTRHGGHEVRTGEWYSPSGELCRRGIAPDIAIEEQRDGEHDAILDAAYAVLEAGD